MSPWKGRRDSSSREGNDIENEVDLRQYAIDESRKAALRILKYIYKKNHPVRWKDIRRNVFGSADREPWAYAGFGYALLFVPMEWIMLEGEEDEIDLTDKGREIAQREFS